MALKIYDTLRRRKVDFAPRDKAHVRVYVCGPTVYDYAHIGNARPVVVFDVLYRLLNRLYPRVTYVRNITDVDDKINAAAKESGEPIQAITERTTDAFHADMKALGALDPTAEPKATEHIEEMIALVKELLAKDHAYEAEGHVLFSVASMSDYGRLSRLDRDALIAGARVEVAPYKKDPADFVLWKPSTPDLPGWASPWGRSPHNPTGRGRPGWHLECSAMSEKFLGKSFDIHGGGQDLIFPHHENEIAQSTCVNGHDAFAKYWMHNGYLMAEGEKMSKSLGNFYTVHDLLEEFPGEAIRFLLLQSHYRAPLDFRKSDVEVSKSKLNQFYQALRKTADIEAMPSDVPEEIMEALQDDLNTALVHAHLFALEGSLNKAILEGDKNEIARRKGRLLAAGEVLGLLQQNPEAWFKGGEADDAEIDKLLAARNAARQAKDFRRADEIRKELDAQGIVLEDSAGGTTWRRK
jgi:cysteinyl-tRNA synthetase